MIRPVPYIGLLMIPLLSSALGDCPNGYMRHDESCYSLTLVKATWAEAVVYCNRVGAHLAHVESDNEHRFIQSLLTRESATVDSDGVWLGGMDFVTEGFWQWGQRGSAIDKRWWHPGQPDNHTGQNCLVMYKAFNFDWDDFDCFTRVYFICEVERALTPVIG